LDEAVDAWERDFLAKAAGPEDFNLVDFGGGAKAEVKAEVGGGSVAATAKDVGALADAASGEKNFGADGVARGMNGHVDRKGEGLAAVGRR